jgi:hypothetical protein
MNKEELNTYLDKLLEDVESELKGEALLFKKAVMLQYRREPNAEQVAAGWQDWKEQRVIGIRQWAKEHNFELPNLVQSVENA